MRTRARALINEGSYKQRSLTTKGSYKQRALTNEGSYKQGLLQLKALTGVFEVRLPEDEDRRLVWK